jgi:hypothetical protein
VKISMEEIVQIEEEQRLGSKVGGEQPERRRRIDNVCSRCRLSVNRRLSLPMKCD